jgi:hypothetical protein
LNWKLVKFRHSRVGTIPRSIQMHWRVAPTKPIMCP